jgi:hypothetical protein
VSSTEASIAVPASPPDTTPVTSAADSTSVSEAATSPATAVRGDESLHPLLAPLLAGSSSHDERTVVHNSCIAFANAVL